MLSHELKCIFVHIPKTAGTSIERYFLDLLGLDQDQLHLLLLQRNEDSALGPPGLAHLKANAFVECGHVSQEQYDKYFKFSFVRNPWDRMVSFYHYLGHAKKTDFSDFVFNHFYRRQWREMAWFTGPQKDFIYNQSDQLQVDFVARFETLEKDFDSVCSQLGIPSNELPREMSGYRKTRSRDRPYQSYYKPETRLWVAEMYRTDIEQFGYSFES